MFFIAYLRPLAPPRKLFLLSVLAALIAVNRVDAVLLVSIPFILVLVEKRGFIRDHVLKAAGLLLLGFTPFIAWELFSLVYYGFLVPNTAFAKLNTGIPQADLLRHGLTYLVQSTRVDYLHLSLYPRRRGRRTVGTPRQVDRDRPGRRCYTSPTLCGSAATS